MVYAQGRAGLGAGIISIFVMTVLILAIERSGRFGRFNMLVAATIAVLGSAWYLATTTDNSSYRSRFFILFSRPLEDQSLVFRLTKWREGLAAAFRNPLGVGLLGFPSAGSDTWIVHNLWLYVSLSFGILGLSGFTLLMYVFFGEFLRGVRSSSPDAKRFCVIGIGCMVCLMVTGMFSPVIWEPYTVAMIWVPFGTCYAAAKLERTQLLARP